MEKKKLYFIGVDGGGTKTVAALADLRGRIIRRAVAGPSNPNKVGEDLAITNLGKAIAQLMKGTFKKRAGYIYIALAGGLERDVPKRERLKKALLKRFPSFRSFSRKIKIEGDQRAAFRSATGARDGIVLIAGTGSIAMGWKDGKEAIAGGWDYILGDQGSAFWIGQEALRQVCQELDGRGPKTKFLTKYILAHLKVNKESDLIKKVYHQDLVETVASLASVVNRAARAGDPLARKLLQRAGRELAIAALAVIRELGFQDMKFPVVLIGGVFKSGIVLDQIKKTILRGEKPRGGLAPFRGAPSARFILPKAEPVAGAIRLAIEKCRGV